jgi:nitrous oxidase accessory protein
MKTLGTFLLALLQISAFAKIISVKPGNHPTIKEALAIAVPFDTINVEKGLFREGNIVIDKPLTFLGHNSTLDGENKFEIISVTSSHVTIDGFTIINSGVSGLVDYAGIKIKNKNHAVITNNILKNCFFGIYLQQAGSCVIRNNSITGYKTEEQQSGNGIHCWKSAKLIIAENHVSGQRDGIYFEFVTNSVIKNNYSHGNLRYGLHFMFSNDDTYLKNKFENNGAGVSVMFSHGVHMYYNHFYNNWGDSAYGILLKEISDSKILYNQFENNTSGIYMEGASRVQMSMNLFKNNGWGIKIQASCMDINVHLNNFTGNTFDVSTNGSLVLNSFNHNYWDKYEGYDLNKDKMGDVPFHPVSLYATIIENNPPAIFLFRSFITTLMDKTEKLLPGITPKDLVDSNPFMQPIKL